MSREPSIHVRESHLKLVLQELLADKLVDGIDIEKLAMTISERVLKYSATSRAMVITSDRLERKAKSILKAAKGDAYLMAKIIHAIRISMKHRGVQMYNQDSREWGMVKEITSNAIDFANEFGLSKKEGFTEYIKIAVSKMQRFSIQKVPRMYESIMANYEATTLIREDDKPKITKSIHDGYIQKIARKVGFVEKYDNNPEKYVCFYKARLIADEIGVSYRDYIEAQFEGFSYRDGIPDPVQLLGDGAKKRLMKYLYENNIKVNPTQKKTPNTNFWATLKSMSDEEN